MENQTCRIIISQRPQNIPKFTSKPKQNPTITLLRQQVEHSWF